MIGKVTLAIPAAGWWTINADDKRDKDRPFLAVQPSSGFRRQQPKQHVKVFLAWVGKGHRRREGRVWSGVVKPYCKDTGRSKGI